MATLPVYPPGSTRGFISSALFCTLMLLLLPLWACPEPPPFPLHVGAIEQGEVGGPGVVSQPWHEGLALPLSSRPLPS